MDFAEFCKRNKITGTERVGASLAWVAQAQFIDRLTRDRDALVSALNGMMRFSLTLRYFDPDKQPEYIAARKAVALEAK